MFVKESEVNELKKIADDLLKIVTSGDADVIQEMLDTFRQVHGHMKESTAPEPPPAE